MTRLGFSMSINPSTPLRFCYDSRKRRWLRNSKKPRIILHWNSPDTLQHTPEVAFKGPSLPNRNQDLCCQVSLVSFEITSPLHFTYRIHKGSLSEQNAVKKVFLASNNGSSIKDLPQMALKHNSSSRTCIYLTPQETRH